VIGTIGICGTIVICGIIVNCGIIGICGRRTLPRGLKSLCKY